MAFSNWLKLNSWGTIPMNFLAWEILVDIDAEDRDLATAFGDEGADDADGGRLAGAVGTQQGEEIALLHLEADALQGLEAVVVGLAADFLCVRAGIIRVYVYLAKRAIVPANPHLLDHSRLIQRDNKDTT